MVVLKFTIQDLELNKQGELSQIQIQNLQRHTIEENQRFRKMNKLGIIIIFIVLFVNFFRKPDLSFQNIGQYLLGSAIFLALFYYIQWQTDSMKRTYKNFLANGIQNVQVKCFNGKVKFGFGRDRFGIIINYFIKIGGAKIPVSQEIQAAFEEGKNYNIYAIEFPPLNYYVKQAIVSAEKISE